jgi:hypothetical protein
MPPRRHWGGIEHHHRAVDRGQGAVGVLTEIPVGRARSALHCLQVMTAADRNAAAQRSSSRSEPAVRVDLARQLDGSAKQQQFLAERGLARVRMRDAARNLVDKVVLDRLPLFPRRELPAASPRAKTRGRYNERLPLFQR